MLRFTTLLALQLLVLASICFGQNEVNYDLPPGAIPMKKAELIVDHSLILNELDKKSNVDQNCTGATFLNGLTTEDIDNMNPSYPEDFEYYQRAWLWHSGLSQKVKCAFTTDELWDIYMYDQKLKNKLSSY